MAESILKLRVDSQEYESKIKRAAQGIQRMAEACHKAGGTLNVLEDENRDFIKSLGNMETVSKSARGKIAELTTAFTDLKSVYNAMSAAEKNGEVGKELNKQLEIMKGRILDGKRELQEIGKELEGGNGKFGQFGSILNGIGQKMGINANITELLTSRTALLTGAIGASVAVVGKAADEWAKYNAELAKQDQITTVTTGLKGDEANRMTDQARAIVDTYNVDFRETINAANTLMTQFGKTGEEAMALISDGMRGMIQGDGGKLLSMIQQYAPSFHDAGIAADQLVAIIHNSEGGLFTDQNMNAIVMGIKNIRLMTKSTSEALTKLGIDGQEMTRKLNDGSMTIFEAMQKVSNVINQTGSASQAAGEVMQAVFGRQGTSAGTKLGEAIATLNTNLDETKKKTGELGESFNDLYKANIRLNTAIRDAFGYDGWEQMANGIKSKLIGALSDVIEHLVIIEEGFGKIKNFFGGGGGNKGGGIGYSDVEKVQQWINNGKDDDERRRRYDKAIADLQKKLNNVGKEYSVKNPDGSTSFKIDDAEAQARKREALEKRMSMLYATKYTPEPEVIKPIVPEPKNPKGGTKTPKTEEQLNSEQIQKLTQEYQKLATAEKTASEAQLKDIEARKSAIQNEIGKLQDRNKELARFASEAKGVNISGDSLPGLTQQLKELQTAQAESANGNEWNEYQKKIESVTDKINVLKGSLPKDRQATFTLDVNAEQLEQLWMLLPTENKTVRINVEEGTVDLPEVPTDDKTIKINITADTADAMKHVRDLVSDIEGTSVVIEPKVEIQEQDLRTPFERLQDIIRIKIAEQNMEVDTNTLQTLMQTAIKNGIDSLNPDFASLQEKMREGINIPDETWQALQDQINEKLKGLGIEPIQIDFSTGNVKKQAKEMSKDWQSAAQAVQAVGSAMASIEDPAAKVVGTVAQAIASIALGYSQATVAEAKTGNPWAWVAFAATGMAQMVSMISAIHSATGYTEGGMIKGNSYSGDNIAGLVDGSQFVGLNAGEIVLNQAMAGNVARGLEGNAGGRIDVVGEIQGEKIVLVANRYFKRTGQGEIVTWR